MLMRVVVSGKGVAGLLLLWLAVCNGEEDWVVMEPGSGLPVILSAPHGGAVSPADFRDRDAGCWVDNQCIWNHDCSPKDFTSCKATTVRDQNTEDLVRLVRDELCRICGACPAMVYARIRRKKVDLNRDIKEAAFGVPEMERVWTSYHSFINQSKAALTQGGLLLDIHGHGHSAQRAELGYLIKGTQLDAGTFNPNATSVRYLASQVGGDFEELLRGAESFGGLLEQEGFPAVPSPGSPAPHGEKYFNGGYITKAHGSRYGGSVDAIQVESARSHRMDGARRIYAKALARTAKTYLQMHYSHVTLPPGMCTDEDCISSSGPAASSDRASLKVDEVTTPGSQVLSAAMRIFPLSWVILLSIKTSIYTVI